jgi:hypothetical protein
MPRICFNEVMLMPLVIHRWIVCLLLLLFIQISASTVKYQPLFNQNHYLLEAILQVQAVDLGADHRAELLVAGKNYINRELFVYCLEFSHAGKPLVKWRSANLFEAGSILWMTVGDFSGAGQQLLVVTKRQYYFYDFDQNGFKLVAKLNSDDEPLTVAAADLDGDAITELIFVKVSGITNNAYNCAVEIRKIINGKFITVNQSGLFGNIRAITTGDADHDGQLELVVEEGLRLNTGKIHFYRFINNQLKETGKFQPASDGAIYAMKVRNFPEGARFVIGSTQGKINILKWNNDAWVPSASKFTVKSSLVDLEVVDLTGDGQPELITVGYPAKFTVWGLR